MCIHMHMYVRIYIYSEPPQNRPQAFSTMLGSCPATEVLGSKLELVLVEVFVVVMWKILVHSSENMISSAAPVLTLVLLLVSDTISALALVSLFVLATNLVLVFIIKFVCVLVVMLAEVRVFMLLFVFVFYLLSWEY